MRNARMPPWTTLCKVLVSMFKNLFNRNKGVSNVARTLHGYETGNIIYKERRMGEGQGLNK